MRAGLSILFQVKEDMHGFLKTCGLLGEMLYDRRGIWKSIMNMSGLLDILCSTVIIEC